MLFINISLKELLKEDVKTAESLSLRLFSYKHIPTHQQVFILPETLSICDGKLKK